MTVDRPVVGEWPTPERKCADVPVRGIASEWQRGAIVSAEHKGFPVDTVGRPVEELRGALSLTSNGFSTPALLLAREAMESNIESMQGFCDRSGLLLAPHVKTTMSPEIVELQLRHGAWGVTVATIAQAAVMREAGAARIVVANEIFDERGIEWLSGELDDDDGFDAFCQVDSEAGVDMLDRVMAAKKARRDFPVLIEFGIEGGRAGVRSVEEARVLAESIRRARYLRLAGVAGFEGIVGKGDGGERADEVWEYLTALRAVADAVFPVREHSDPFLVTVGGSCYMEMVADVFGRSWISDRPMRTVLRSGCYVTHDSEAYEKFRVSIPGTVEELRFRPGLELWATVLSRPEKGLAILNFGRRETGTDAGLPIPLWLLRRGRGRVCSAPPCVLSALNDQHAYLTGTGTGELNVDVGDLVGFGISHPCTVFDKWRLIPVVDADRTMIGAVRTRF